MQQQNKELFQHYEIKNWNYSPLFYQLLGAAAIFNLLAILVVGQTNLLTRKGCESPLVGRVCQVLDTVYVGSILLGTEREYVDKDYVKTELADADITFVNVGGQEPPLNYPEGYFALANPEEFAARQNADNLAMMTNPIPGMPMNPTISNAPDLMSMPQTVPTPNNKAITGPVPTSPFSFGDNPIGANPVPPPSFGKNRPPRMPPPRKPRMMDNLPKPPPNGDDMMADNKKNADQKQLDPTQPEIKSDPVADVEINKKPIKDLGVFVNGLIKDEKVKLNLETPFMAKANGKLTKDGKLDPKSFKIEANSPDKNMVEVIQESIEAINDAGYLQYLKVLSGKDLNLELSQDDENITATVKSEVESDTRARSLKSSFNLLISGAKLTKTDPNDKDDLDLLNSATVESDGKNLIIKFKIPKPLAQEMIKRKLLEQETKPQTNNTAQKIGANQTVTK